MPQVDIRFRGHLDESWTLWFDGFVLTHTPECETILSGPVKDQATLYGLMSKLRDLGVHLIAVTYREETAKNRSA